MNLGGGGSDVSYGQCLFLLNFPSRRSLVVSWEKETRTEDNLLRGREHVQRKGDLVLVPFALEELDE